MSRKPRKGINWASLILLVVLAAVYFSVGGGARMGAEPQATPTAQLVATAAAPTAFKPGGGEERHSPQPTGTPGAKETVAAHLRAHGRLPDYYITKAQARELGWQGGSLEGVAPGKLIGGDRFGNFEGQLPRKAGRSYYECDINTHGKSTRGAERIVFSNDGLIFYTKDHYESFVELREGP